MKGNVLLEGVDGTGKSTLAKALTELYPDSRVEHRGPPKRPEDELAQAAEDLVMLNNERGIVMDRTQFLSPRVYAPMFRGYDPSGEVLLLEGKLAPHNLLVLLDATVPTLEARYDGEFIERRQIPHLRREYHRALASSPIRHKLRLMTDGASVDTLVLSIVAKMETDL
jgi:energy-coupling factor transporter ATP-binding protein EcfA2